MTHDNNASNNIDLLISDIELSGEFGLDLIKQIKKRKSKGKQIRLGIEALDEVSINREEVYLRIKQKQQNNNIEDITI
ncbi:MAG: carbon storage regulator [Gammaproteobacteria bacterium]|jgi:two-component SAPR family response regulator